MSRNRKITFVAVLVALALVLQLVEGFFPFIAPGVKLGLANIVSLIAIIYLGFRPALLVVGLRVFLAALLSGRPYLLIIGGMGALLSICLMGLVYWRFRKHFSIQGISILGAVAHNIGQITMASLLFDTIGFFSYLPFMLVAGVIAGYLIGVTVKMLQKVLDPIFQKNLASMQNTRMGDVK